MNYFRFVKKFKSSARILYQDEKEVYKMVSSKTNLLLVPLIFIDKSQ